MLLYMGFKVLNRVVLCDRCAKTDQSKSIKQKHGVKGAHLMHSTQRERKIMEILNEAGSCRIQDLARRLGVTDETIRRNIRRMEENGLVTKVHGGVYLKDWERAPSFAERFTENAAAKQLIAKHVAGMIRNGDTLFLDTGSTTAYVADALRQHEELLVVTNSLPVAQVLSMSSGNRIFMAGGELRSHDGGAFSAQALAFVRQFRVRHAVLSVAAIQADIGFMLHDLREAEFSRQIIDCASQAIIAADVTKFRRQAPICLTEPDNIDIVVTDAPPPPDSAAWLKSAEIELEVVGHDKPGPMTGRRGRSGPSANTKGPLA